MLDKYKHLVFDRQLGDYISFYPKIWSEFNFLGIAYEINRGYSIGWGTKEYLDVPSYIGDSNLNPFNAFNTRFLRTEKTPNVLYMGVELEINLAKKDRLASNNEDINYNHYRNTWIGIKKNVAPFAVVKNDGSIPQGSAKELVTLPMSLGFHREFWKEFFTTYKPRMWKLSTRCGLHIHMDARTLTPMHQTKIVQLVNDPSSRKFFEDIIGERKNNRFARYQNRKIHQCFNTDAVNNKYKRRFKKFAWSNVQGEKYSAINTNTYKNTIEFRLFRGQKSYDKVMKAIEFVDAIYYFTRDNSYRDNNLTSFLNWVGERQDSYPELTKILIKKGSLKIKLVAA